MRLIGTLNNPKEAHQFGAFIAQEGIENQVEFIKNTDWGSPNYGDQEARIWVVDEDKYPLATVLLEKYQKDPLDPFFVQYKTIKAAAGVADTEPTDEEIEMQYETQAKEPPNFLTLYFLITCVLIFAVSMMTIPDRERVALPYPSTAIYSAELTQSLLFDFPEAYDILENIVNTYGIKGLQDPSSMPPEGQQLLQQYAQTPYWRGYYDQLVLRWQEKPYQLWETQAPLFEKISQGQVWRLFSPVLLHADIFHLLFNMIWLLVLGRQMEQRLKPFRYLLFILGVGIFSNMAQYLMSGPNFLGFSGILIGMFTFIWMRQRRAAWEGYQLQKSTAVLMGIFVGGLFLIQVASFLSEVYTGTPVAPLIANTAHLSGGFAGLVLGRLNFFAWKK